MNEKKDGVPIAYHMRVLHVHSGNLYGGIETLMVTLGIHRNLCRSMEPHFALCFEGRLSDELADAGVVIHRLGEVRVSRPFSVVRSRQALRELLSRESFDVVICHSSWSQAIFGPVVHSAGLPLVFWLHGAANGRHWLERWARRCVPEFVICNSRFTHGTLPNLYPNVRSEVVYYPVVFSETNCTERASVREEFHTPQNATVIIQVSRMEPWKGHRQHLEALSLLRDLPDWVGWQIGGGQRPHEVKYQEELKALAAQLRIADRVRFIGQRTDVSRLLSAADIFCQPNTGAEPFGIAFIEALSAGLPVVTTAIGGATEIVDDSCGILVPPGDSSALASSLRHLIQDSAVRSQLAASGPARAHSLCDTATQIRRLEELLTERVQTEAAA